MPGTNLTREEAQKRAELIATKRYEIALDLTQGAKNFKASTKVFFTANSPGATSFIDLIADSVERVELNGKTLDPETVFNDSRIKLPNLQPENELLVESTQAYTNTGEGMHRFVDPADGEVYLYTQFEVPDSRRVFAVFEQPDLKANFQFTITAPAHWLVVSNQPTPEPEPAGKASSAHHKPGEEIATWHFSDTPIMSSYITAIIAGPYKGTRDSLVNSEGREIPLGVFCRSSLHTHLDADYIIEKTKQGFEFFEKTFNFPYPFAKYDQVFVPEFNMGAMENIGAVTHTEAYVFRGNVEDAMKERRVVTVLHELAHMWFGDLVTMKWWNDLWLNESFAEYTSVLATAEATEWHEAWTTFASMEKAWAYRQDQLPSTHPIVAPIRDLEDVMANFDGITYAKGASVLKALVSYVGRENFFNGVHNYFVKHQYSNTVLADLLAELEATSGRNLRNWSNAWLETAGVNTLKAEFAIDDNGAYTSFNILQSADPQYDTIRPHRIAIGLYNVVDGKLQRQARYETDVAAEKVNLPEIIGQQQPDLLLLNDEDLSYAKVRFDARSLKTALSHVGDSDDSLTRAVIWGALWDACRDGELAAKEFISTVLAHIGKEDQSSTLRTVLGQLQTAIKMYADRKNYAQLAAHAAENLYNLAQTAKPGSDSQFQLLKSFAALARTEQQLEVLKAFYNGETSLTGLTVDTDLKWVLLTALVAGGCADEVDIAAAQAADTTAAGQQAAAKARAALPTPEGKTAAWRETVLNPEAANLILRAAGQGFLTVHDTNLLEPYVEQYFEVLPTIWKERSYQISEEILSGFFPSALANTRLRDAAQDWLAANPNAAPTLRRFIIEHLADVERALNAQLVDSAA